MYDLLNLAFGSDSTMVILCLGPQPAGQGDGILFVLNGALWQFIAWNAILVEGAEGGEFCYV